MPMAPLKNTEWLKERAVQRTGRTHEMVEAKVFPNTNPRHHPCLQFNALQIRGNAPKKRNENTQASETCAVTCVNSCLNSIGVHEEMYKKKREGPVLTCAVGCDAWVGREAQIHKRNLHGLYWAL